MNIDKSISKFTKVISPAVRKLIGESQALQGKLDKAHILILSKGESSETGNSTYYFS